MASEQTLQNQTATQTTWDLDPTHSVAGFSVKHLMIATVTGRFRDVTATLVFDEEDITRSSVVAELAATSVDTGVADRDAHLRSADFFDVEKFPTVTFRSTRVESVGDARARIVGDLTIRDETHEVVLDATLEGRAQDPWGNDRLAFTAETSISRKEFGLKWNQALETGGVLVGDKVKIQLDVQVVKRKAE